MKKVVVATLAFVLAGCADLSASRTAPATVRKVEFGFIQYAPRGAASCEHYGPKAAAAPLPALVFSWIAGRVVKSFAKKADREIKKYSSERASNGKYADFYDVQLWSNVSVGGNPVALSCFAAQQIECDLPGDTSPDTACPASSHGKPRFVIEGAFVRTPSWMKAVATSAEVQGIATEKYNKAPKATAGIAATLTFEAVWVEGGRGHKEKLFEVPLFKSKFSPNFAAPISVLKTSSNAEFAKRLEAAEMLPLPPRAAAGTTQVKPIVRVAEVSSHPVVLDWIKSFLDSEGDGLSSALADALDSI